MGVQDIVDEGELIAQDNLTISDLKRVFGREATRRGLEYMKSLSEAEEEFRDSISGEQLERGWERAYGDGGTENSDEAISEWEKKSKQKGIGLEDE